MRPSHTLALISALLLASPSHAASGASDPCLLLDWHDFEFMGITEKSGIESSGWHNETPPAELPGSTLATGLCAAVKRNDKGRVAMTLQLSSLKGGVSEAQFVDWLKNIATASERENQKDIKEFKLGETECESGRDVLVIPAMLEGDEDTTVVEHFLACDEHVGLVHISLNAQASQDRKADLPDAATVKALLDKSVARMKQTTFKTPN